MSVTLRILKWLLLAELLYLFLVNAALRVDFTQDVVNSIRPDKFHVSWDSAWSWFPWRVHARGIHAHGQSRRQQWEVRAEAASGAISLLPLLAKRVHLSALDATDVTYRQRPRLRADKDYTAIQDYFPPIADRDMLPADTSPRKHRRPWTVRIDDGRVSGQLSYWIYNLRGSGSGKAAVDLAYRSRGGPLSMDVRDIDLDLQPALLNGAEELFQGGTVAGSLGFEPFVPQEHKGVGMMPFLYGDIEVDLLADSLGFIGLFTGNLSELVVDGAGRVRGRLHYNLGYLLEGTDLSVRATDLSVAINGMQLQGQGAVDLRSSGIEETPLALDIAYEALTVTRDADAAPFLEGDGLQLTFTGTNYIVVEAGTDANALLYDDSYKRRRQHSNLRLLIDDATLIDVSLLNDYLPETTGVKLTGGTAQLQADVFAGLADMEGGLQLDGKNLGLQVEGQDLRADLAVDVVLSGGAPGDLKMELDGSKVTLDQVRVAGARQSFEDEYWSAQVHFREARAHLGQPLHLRAETDLRVSDTRPLVTLFNNQRRSPGWLSRMLTVTDIEGAASLELDGQHLRIVDARMLGDKAEIAARAGFYPGGREGMIYARYNKLDAVLKLEGEDSNVDLLRARDKFETYQLAPAAAP